MLCPRAQGEAAGRQAAGAGMVPGRQAEVIPERQAGSSIPIPREEAGGGGVRTRCRYHGRQAVAA